MAEPTLNYVSCPDPQGGHRMAYWQWGQAGAGHLVVCVHGLSRQGRDFDTLARALLAQSPRPLRVVCPDVVGRGRSDWLKDPMGYQFPQYVGDMLALLAQLHGQAPVLQLDWVGTSMGGVIGMALAATPGLPLPVPVHMLVLNDIGPAVQWQGLSRIGTFLGQTGRFDSVRQAADALWQVSRGFGPHTPQQWLDLSAPMVRPLPDGGFTLHYDPAIAVPVREVTEAISLQGRAAMWQLYDQLRCQVLLLRGADSDLLSHETAVEMGRRGPRAQLREFSGVGHAPTLIADGQVRAVTDFLLQQGPLHETPGGRAA